MAQTDLAVRLLSLCLEKRGKNKKNAYLEERENGSGDLI